MKSYTPGMLEKLSLEQALEIVRVMGGEISSYIADRSLSYICESEETIIILSDEIAQLELEVKELTNKIKELEGVI